MTRRGLAPLALALALLGPALAPPGGAAHAQGAPAPYPGTPPSTGGGDLLLQFAVPIYDVFCWSDVLTAEVIAVDPRAGITGAGFPVSEVRARVLERIHRRGEGCQSAGDALHVPEIPGLLPHEIGDEEVTLRLVGGVKGRAPYETLQVARGEPYAYPGQRLFLILPESQRRPLAFEIAPDGRLFDPADGRLVLYTTANGIGLQRASALAPAAEFFLYGGPAQSRVYPSEEELGDSGLFDSDLTDDVVGRLEFGPDREPPPPPPDPNDPSSPGSGSSRPVDGVWGHHIGDPNSGGGRSSGYPGTRDVWRRWSTRGSGR